MEFDYRASGSAHHRWRERTKFRSQTILSFMAVHKILKNLGLDVNKKKK